MKTLMLMALMFALAPADRLKPVLQAHSAGLLDGKTFSGSVGQKGKAAESNDDLIFANGQLRSTGCDPYGFSPGPYTAIRNGDTITFTATTKSPKSGTIEWQGTIRNGVLEGSFVWKTYLVFRRTYWIKANQK